jgi:hypothetical protein
MKTSSRLFVLATRLALGVACWSGLGSVAQEKGTEDKSKAKGKDAPKAIVSAESKSEYKVTVLGDDDQATETELNKLGDEGWELVGTPVGIPNDTASSRDGGPTKACECASVQIGNYPDRIARHIEAPPVLLSGFSRKLWEPRQTSRRSEARRASGRTRTRVATHQIK